MARRLVATVVVGGVAYTAGSKVPDDVAKQITNPAAWEAQEDAQPAQSPEPVAAPDKEPETPAPARAAGGRRSRQS